MLEFSIAIAIFFVGLAGIIVRKNLFIKLLSLEIMNIALTIIFLLIGYNNGQVPVTHDVSAFVVDPLTQNLVITAIIIGFATMSLMLVFLVRIVEKYRTLDINKLIRRFKKE
jgi:multicomponent Na+:H+ antiporter subunit C